MKTNLTCNYCGCNDKRTYYMLSLTSITDRSNTCTKIICDKCAEHIGMTLDEILDKRDVDEVLKEIENDPLNNQ